MVGSEIQNIAPDPSTDSQPTSPPIDSVGVGSNALYVGNFGTGELHIEDGGRVSNVNGFIATQNGSGGTANVSGEGSLWANSGDLVVAGNSTTSSSNGVGTLTITDGGTVSVNGTTHVHSNGLIHLKDGGTLRTHDLHFASGVFHFAGGTLIASGTITGNLDIAAQGTLSGMPTIIGDVVNSGTVAPGNSPGILNVEGNFSQTGSGRIVMEIGGTAQGTEYDFLHVNSHMHFSGTLELVKLGIFDLTEGDQFQLFTFQSVSGAFTTIEAFNPGNGLAWDFTRLNTEGEEKGRRERVRRLNAESLVCIRVRLSPCCVAGSSAATHNSAQIASNVFRETIPFSIQPPDTFPLSCGRLDCKDICCGSR